MKISSKISDTVVKIVTLKDVGITEFFSQTNQSVKQYNAYKEVLANNPELAMKLVNKDLPLEEKQKYANEFKFALEKKLGYSLGKEVKVISTDEKGQGEKDIKGFISTENDNMYSNDKNQHSTKETIAALGQEFAGAMQIKKGIDITTNRVQHNNYQDSISNDTVGDISFIMNTYHNKSLAKTNTHNQTTSVNSVFNLADNNSEFKGLDKELGDNDKYENLFYRNKMYGGTRYKRQKNAEKMFDSTVKVEEVVSLALRAKKIDKIPFVGSKIVKVSDTIIVSATVMKYLVTPDAINLKDILDDTLSGKSILLIPENLK